MDVRELERDLLSHDDATRVQTLQRMQNADSLVLVSLLPLLKARLSKNLEVARRLNPTDANWGSLPDSIHENLKALAAERLFVIRFVQKVGRPSAPLLPELMQLAQSYVDQDTPFHARESIRAIGRKALPILIQELKDPNNSDSDKLHAAHLIAGIAQDLQAQGDTDAIPDLERALQAVISVNIPAEMSSQPQQDELRMQIENAVQALKDSRRLQFWRKVAEWWDTNPWVRAPVVLLALFASAWGLVLWLWPLWLVWLDSSLDLSGLMAKGFKLLHVPLRPTFIAETFIYPPRVLDAWVSRQLPAVREAFNRLSTVSSRRIAVPLPVNIDGVAHAELTPQLLKRAFSSRRCYLVIHGEGGAGKTTLACLIAFWGLAEDTHSRLRRHLMLPVLIEDDLKEPLDETVRGTLQAQVGAKTPLRDQLIHALLQTGRIAVIVDGLSEHDETTRAVIRPTASGFLPSTLIVTSRKQEGLGNAPLVRITPTRISGNRLSNFVGAYLTKLGRREAFDDPEFFAVCGDLSRLVGARDITALLAKLYVDLMLARKDGEASGSAPRNIPELIMAYLGGLNKRPRRSDPDDAMVQKDAKVLAWCCLRRTLRPGHVALDEALSELSGENREERVRYLKEGLAVIENVGPNAQRLRFSLDPVAEYLAALHIVEIAGSSMSKWAKVFERIGQCERGSADCASFVNALAEYVASESGSVSIPPVVVETFVDHSLHRDS